ncbi:MAG: diphthine--ammonia ligase [Thaumarchaeota archaeon]|nr:diphthine--ammonia ligase [Nitrososphaerota archaeon]MBT5993010.1 diphthine--ammonia ligase [Nitrososphaerota archaeon]
MKLAALFSGGKDSTYAIYLAKKLSHSVDVLLTLYPHSSESHLLHHPNIKFTSLQAESMKIPQLIEKISSIDTKAEFEKLDKLITRAKENYSIEGIVHGGILSKYQKDNFSSICEKNNLEIISPLWNTKPESYMKKLLEENFEYIISSVSSDGLNDSWLGQIIDKNRLETLEKLQKKFGFNLNFEGGEAETFVINCPLFEKSLFIQDYSTEWDGYRGRFEILDVKLKDNA